MCTAFFEMFVTSSKRFSRHIASNGKSRMPINGSYGSSIVESCSGLATPWVRMASIRLPPLSYIKQAAKREAGVIGAEEGLAL